MTNLGTTPHGHRLEDFHFGTPVQSADGKLVGSLQRVIVDQESLDVHAIVVKETRHFSGHYLGGAGLLEDDLAIPIQAVQEASRDRILVSENAKAIRSHAPYLTYQYAPVTKGDVARMGVALAGGLPYVPRLIENEQKRPDELEIDRGENVMLGHTGKKLGTVHDVVMEDGELIGIVLHPEGFFKEDVLLQIRFLGRSDDLALFAYLSEADLEHLTPFHPSDD